MDNKISVTRKTTESEMSVTLDFSPIKPDYRKKINTTIPFLNHMIEHIAWRSGINIETKVILSDFTLSHLITEDLGMALGKAVAEYIKKNKDKGVTGFGDARGMIDEALAQTAMSFESRAYFNIEYHDNALTESVEDMDTQDLETFLEGFCQGACCTLQIDLFRGHNGHHIWEAIYRSFGSCLKNVTYLDPTRAGMTSGVAGTIDWEIQ